jgi:hypothetical protein
VSSLSQDIQKSEGWKRFPMLDIIAILVVAVAVVALEKIYGGDALYAIAFLMVIGGIIVALPFDTAGFKRWSLRDRSEAIKGFIYGGRIFLITAISSVLGLLLLNYI